MLYRFSSRETADVLMLETHARALLEIIGRPPGPTGIIVWTSMALATQRLQQAIQADEARLAQTEATKEKAREEPEPLENPVGLRQRAAPLLAMMSRCQAAQRDIVWGV
jgi:hypothetical protein